MNRAFVYPHPFRSLSLSLSLLPSSPPSLPSVSVAFLDSFQLFISVAYPLSLSLPPLRRASSPSPDRHRSLSIPERRTVRSPRCLDIERGLLITPRHNHAGCNPPRLVRCRSDCNPRSQRFEISRIFYRTNERITRHVSTFLRAQYN